MTGNESSLGKETASDAAERSEAELTPPQAVEHTEARVITNATADEQQVTPIPPEARIMDPEVVKLIEDHMEFAQSIALTFRGRGQSIDDLKQVALAALTGAAQRFDPSMGFKFKTFAEPTIAGELKRHFRENAWQARVPRGIKEIALKVRTTRIELQQKLRRYPTTAELAEATQVPEASIEEAIHALSSKTGHSLSSPAGAEISIPVEADEHKLVEDILTAQALLNHLNTDERKIIHMRFWEGKNQTEIAKEMGTYQMEISRRLQAIFQKLGEISRD